MNDIAEQFASPLSNFPETALKAVEKASGIPAWLTLAEKISLALGAHSLPPGSVIAETGCLYGGSTAILALASKPGCKVFSFDDFSWNPFPERSPNCREKVIGNLAGVGADLSKVEIVAGDSRVTMLAHGICPRMVFVDGGHSKEFVSSDIGYAKLHADIVFVHDYENLAWPEVCRESQKLLGDFRLAATVDSMGIFLRNVEVKQ